MFILMVLVLVVVSLLLISLARVVLIEKNLFNLIYLIGSNIIFALGAWFFYFYFHEIILSVLLLDLFYVI